MPHLHDLPAHLEHLLAHALTGMVHRLAPQSCSWTVGALASHIWGLGGDKDRADVDATFLQPMAEPDRAAASAEQHDADHGADVFAWIRRTAALLRSRRFDELDTELPATCPLTVGQVRDGTSLPS